MREYIIYTRAPAQVATEFVIISFPILFSLPLFVLHFKLTRITGVGAGAGASAGAGAGAANDDDHDDSIGAHCA